MKPLVIFGAIAAVALCGCQKRADDTSASRAAHGRYVGVGIYSAGQMWSQMVVANSPKDAVASKLNDDEEVIVVIDSQTGELRQCGNLSGHCVGMNPWAGPLANSQIAPIPVTKHADELAREAEAAAATPTKHKEARSPSR